MKKGCYTSGSFTQWKRRFYTVADGLTANAVLSLLYAEDGTLFIGTENGLCQLKDGTVTPLFAEVLGAVQSMAFVHDSSLAVCSGNKLYFVKGDAISAPVLFDDTLVALADCRDSYWILTRSELINIHYDFKTVIVRRELEGGCGFALAVNNNNVYVATDLYLSVIHGKRMEWKNIVEKFTDCPSCGINTLAFDNMGFLWLGTNEGIALHDNGSYWLNAERVGSFPKNPVYDIAADAVGGKYFASDIGVIMLNKGTKKYFSAGRWVPDNKVNAVAVSPDGSCIFAATDAGLSVISAEEMTLSKKAAMFEDIIEKYHTRRDFVATRRVPNGVFEDGFVEISDNDGLWTACNVAAEAFHYAATGDKKALDKARRGMNAMLFLTKISGIPGFTARAVRYPGEEGYGDGNREWALAPDGSCEWKGETSSDEMTGHFFGFSVYYDLCADEKEKEEIRKALCGIMDHIVENDYRLVDRDGLPTTWACWDPDMLNLDDKWFCERGVNSLELMTFLKVCTHVSDDEKYQKLYDRFITKYHYPLNIITHKIKDAHFCHIDDNLTFLATLTLLRLEENEDLRAMIFCAMDDHWQYERTERQPLFVMIHAAFSEKDVDLMEGIQSLREIPLDLNHYAMESSKRRDLVYDDEQAEWNVPTQLKEAMPYDERNLHRPDASPFGTDAPVGRHAMEGTIYLLPYWIGRYYGLINESEDEA